MVVVRDVSCVVCKRFSSFDVVATSSTRSGSARETKTETYGTERKGNEGRPREREMDEGRMEGKKRLERGRKKKGKSVELIRVRDNAVAE